MKSVMFLVAAVVVQGALVYPQDNPNLQLDTVCQHPFAVTPTYTQYQCVYVIDLRDCLPDTQSTVPCIEQDLWDTIVPGSCLDQENRQCATHDMAGAPYTTTVTVEKGKSGCEGDANTCECTFAY